MLLRLALVLAALPAIALAQDGAARRTIIPAPKPAAADVTPTAPPVPTPAAPVWSTPALAVADLASSDCRAACAQAGYFCQASDQADGCGASWGQCVAACDLPNLAPSAASSRP